jgi:hypothetical protein
MTNNVTSYSAALQVAIADRIAYEISKNAENDSIVSCINSIAKDVAHDSIASIMMQSSCDANFLNRSERISARYNVYAAEKVANIARAIAVVKTLNHYSLHILQSALALEANAFVLSHKSAVAACSSSIKHSDAKQERVLKSTRYAKHVAAQTASTQASSSLNALCTMNVLSETRDASNAVAYLVNREAFATIALCAKHSLDLTIARVEA